MELYKILASLIVFSLCFSTLPTHAGDLDSPAEPSSDASAMYQLEDIYNRLDDGTTGSKRSGAFTEPASGPVSTGYTLDVIMGKTPQADNANGAAPSEVLNSKTYWGLRTNGSWGPQTGTAKFASGNAVNGDVLDGKTYSNDSGSSEGTMANIGALSITPGTSAQFITQGYHNGSGSVSGDSDLATGNIKSGVNIFGIAGDNNVVNTSTGDAVAGDLLSGKKAWVNGSEVTGTAKFASGNAVNGDVLKGKTYSNDSGSSEGTMVNIGTLSITPGTSPQKITQGYHNGSGSVSGDSDLATGNIKSGVNIFGIAGDSNVVNTSTGDAVAGDLLSGKKAWVNGSEVTGTAAPAAVDKTGQLLCYDPSGSTANTVSCDGTGQDGETQIGTTWPNSRFTDNSDGTITDNLTDLIWLKNANCFGVRNWATALGEANGLANGSCGLNDSSSVGDWRLPNIKELQSLLDFGNWNLALPTGHAFSGVQTSTYWSSSSHVRNPQYAWSVGLYNGNVSYHKKTNNSYVWPVRAGE